MEWSYVTGFFVSVFIDELGVGFKDRFGSLGMACTIRIMIAGVMISL